MAKIKSASDIELLRESGKRLSKVLKTVAAAVRPGISTKELDALAERLIREGGDELPFKGYVPHGAGYPYPACICISVNDEIVHGIPGDRILQEGDIVGLDLGLSHQGLITDSAVSVAVGEVKPEVLKLLEKTKEALWAGIKAAKGGARIGDIGSAIEAVANKEKYGIVRELGGHGVGHAVHEEPYVPNYGKKGTGPILKPGMVLAIEPMFNLGKDDVRLMPDGYTVVTKDGSLSAHFEHTILITEGDAEVLTA
jgi:methionyl aminopeptidase